MTIPNAQERAVGRLHVAEARLRLLIGSDGEVTKANRPQVDELTARIAALRAELGLDDDDQPVTTVTPRPRRDLD